MTMLPARAADAKKPACVLLRDRAWPLGSTAMAFMNVNAGARFALAGACLGI